MSGGFPIATLTITRGPRAGSCRTFASREIVIGRGPSSDFLLSDDSAVSTLHARLVWSEGSWRLEDARSRNGTFLIRDGMRLRVRNAVAIAWGQEFICGKTTLRLDKGLASSGTVERAGESTAERLGVGPRHVLRVELLGDTLRCQWRGGGAYRARHTARFRAEDLARLNDELARMMAALHRPGGPASHPAGPVLDVFHSMGRYIAAHVLPPRISRKLSELEEGPLLLVLDPQLLHVPWELAEIEDEFLCLRLALGRQIVVDDFSSRRVPRTDCTKLSFLLVLDPTENIDGAEHHAEELLELLMRHQDRLAFEILLGRNADRLKLLDRMEGADVVYYFGHGEHDPERPDESGWRLYHDRITCRDFRALRYPPAFVFANACESGKEAPWRSVNPARVAGYGAASGFILAGVAHYLGAPYPIPAGSAAPFAELVFQHLLNGAAIGESLRRARRIFSEGRGEDDPAWAAYALYGNPEKNLM